MNRTDQHDIDNLSLDDLAENPQTITAALAGEAWAENEPDTFVHGQAAKLALMEQGPQWARYRLTTPTLRLPGLSAVLAENASLELPAKFISGTSDQVDCVVDVPLEALTQPDTQPDRFSQDSRCMADWSRGLTGALTETRSPVRHADSDLIAQSLGQLGWAASAEGESLKVHIQLPSVYRSVHIDPSEVGYRISADLIPLADLSSTSAKAVRQLSLEANRRLPLVRFSEHVMTDPPRLLAEVNINVALVPGVWLMQALCAVEAAVTTTSRELLALRDPELAQIFLAGYEPA